MKKIVSFSGGRTSAYLCKLMIDTFGKGKVDFVYMDTGAEHAKTYEFIRNVNREFGLDLICLRGDFSTPLGVGVNYNVVSINEIGPDLVPFTEMLKKYGVPYIGGMFCTDRMKLTPFKKYCDKTYGRKNYETWLGIRADEPSRLVGDKNYKSIKKNLGLDDESIFDMFKTFSHCGSHRLCVRHFVSGEGFEDEIFVNLNSHLLKKKSEDKIRYMAEISDYQKEDVLNWWEDQIFDLDLDEWSGNCQFCPKKSNLKLAASQKDSPEAYDKYVEMLNDDSVRIDNNTGNRNKMYRGQQSLENLISTFDGATGKEIKQRIRGTKSLDTNSCSESCEVFSEN